VKVIIKDDQANTAVAIAAAHELIDQDHVFAVVGTGSNPENEWGPYAQQKGVPVLGVGETSGIIWMTNPDFYPVSTAIISEVYGGLKAAVLAGKPKVAYLYCAESPACASSVPLIKQLAGATGAQLVYTASVSASAPGYAAQCLAAKAAGVQALNVGAGEQEVTRIATDCNKQGVKAIVIGTDGTVSPSWRTNPAFEGEVDVQPLLPWNQQNAATKDYYAAMAQYQPGELHSDTFAANDIGAWASGQLFIAAAKAANLGDNPTSAQLIQGLTSLHNETLGGLTVPLNYAAGKPHQVKCFFIESIHNTQWTQPFGQQPFCQP
jgi:branched-chain amino acid transport system substrate-binding protein